jgi:2-dehydro-3-deoxyphosphooctonate aldolase (KDO 8-P synthase)
MITDRGTMFGYQDMIVVITENPNYATIWNYSFDVNTLTTTTQQMAGVTGGRPDMIEETVAKQELLLV